MRIALFFSTPSPVTRSRVAPRAAAAEGGEATKSQLRRSRRPVRSKYLAPACDDPQARPAGVDPQHWGPPTPTSSPLLGRHPNLPAAYRVDAATWTDGDDGGGVGAFFPERQCSWGSGTGGSTAACTADPAGADALPEYRYAVDADGVIVDMLKAKRAVPASFERGISSTGTAEILGAVAVAPRAGDTLLQDGMQDVLQDGEDSEQAA